MGLDIDKKKVQLKEAIKTPGTHIVPVRLHTKVTARPEGRGSRRSIAGGVVYGRSTHQTSDAP